MCPSGLERPDLLDGLMRRGIRLEEVVVVSTSHKDVLPAWPGDRVVRALAAGQGSSYIPGGGINDLPLIGRSQFARRHIDGLAVW